jgi:hypothetical protein
MAGGVAILPEKLEKFVEMMADGTNFGTVCACLGYTQLEGYTLLQTPRISRLIESRAKSVLRNDLAPKALKFLGELVVNEQANPKERRQAAQFILEKAGYVAPRAQIAEAAEKSISAMSTDELATLVEKLEQERAARAKDVSAPSDAASDSEVTDMLS